MPNETCERIYVREQMYPILTCSGQCTLLKVMTAAPGLPLWNFWILLKSAPNPGYLRFTLLCGLWLVVVRWLLILMYMIMSVRSYLIWLHLNSTIRSTERSCKQRNKGAGRTNRAKTILSQRRKAYLMLVYNVLFYPCTRKAPVHNAPEIADRRPFVTKRQDPTGADQIVNVSSRSKLTTLHINVNASVNAANPCIDVTIHIDINRLATGASPAAQKLMNFRPVGHIELHCFLVLMESERPLKSSPSIADNR
uniref:Uncharacterized protein n=1 Tax=Glossina brevipalpis TaxID=37001 RepID=A0A1A9WHY6_9MUSC